MNEELKFITLITKEAERIYHQSFNEFTKETDSNNNDIVTDIDLKIEQYLINEVKAKYPLFDIVSEETYSKKELTNNCFIIDPIDGTKNFSNHSPFWSIQMSCIKNGKTIASVINIPKFNQMFTADDQSSYLNGVPINVSVVPIKKATYVIEGGDYLKDVVSMQKHTHSQRRFGCISIAMAYVAMGAFHAAVFKKEKPWDYEPGLHIAKMAGAVISSKPGFHACAMNKEFLDILENEILNNPDSEA